MTTLKDVKIVTPQHIVRILQEGDELAARMGRLAQFMNGEKFAALPAIDQQLLVIQFDIMKSYLSTLKLRVARESDKHTGKAVDISPTLGAKPGIILDS